MTKPIISFKNLTYQYESQSEPTLHEINLDIQAGEKILIAGPSGGGKSTIGKFLNGLIPNEEPGEITGSVEVDGTDITKTTLFDLSFSTSTIMQDTDSQFTGLTVAEDVAFALENDAIENYEMVNKIEDWAKKLNLSEIIDQAPQNLSGGQKQRVSLAGVLVNESPILLFDEPLANLDPASSAATIQLIDQIHQETDVTVIIIEHRVEEVLLAPMDRIVVIDNGRIVSDSTPNEILHTTSLQQVGVRVPLYISVLKYAGVDLAQYQHLDDVNSLEFNSEDRDKLVNWDAINQRIYQALQPEERLPQLILSGVGYSYTPNQLTPLHDVKADIFTGQFISIIGQNGAGKTTLSKVICGFVHGTGDLIWNGQNLSNESIKERAEKIGYVMQNPNEMISKKMIFDEVALGLRLRNVDEVDIEPRVNEALRICGLYEFRHWPIVALSFGQKKRVTIAAILVLNPAMIILDEPTAGQDLSTYTEIMEFLKKLNVDNNITIMIITHDVHLMMEYTERSLVFSKGILIADDNPLNVMSNPELVNKASLRETSLIKIGRKIGLKWPQELAQNFIFYEEGVIDGRK